MPQPSDHTTNDVAKRLAALPADDLTKRLAIALAQVDEPLPLGALHLLLWRLGWSVPTAAARRELAGAAARVRRKVGGQATERDGELELELRPEAAQAVRAVMAAEDRAEQQQLAAAWTKLVLGYERLREGEAAGLDPAERALDAVARGGVAWLLAAEQLEAAARISSDLGFLLLRVRAGQTDEIRRDYHAVRAGLETLGDDAAAAREQLAPCHQLVLRTVLDAGEEGVARVLQAALSHGGPGSPLGRAATRWLQREGASEWSLLATSAAPDAGLEMVARIGDGSRTFAVAADGRRAIVGSGGDKTAAVWDLQAGVPVGQLARDDDPWDEPYQVAIAADGLTAVLTRGNEVEVWDVDTGRLRHALEGHTESMSSVAVDDAGQRAVSTGSDKTVRVWDLAAGRCEHVLEGHTDYVFEVAVSGDGGRAVSGGSDDGARLWDLSDGSGRVAEQGEEQVSCRCVAASADGRVIVAGTYNNSICVWDGDSGHLRHELFGHALSVDSVAITPDGRRAVAASGGELRLWDLEAGQLLHVLAGPREMERVVLSPDGRRAIASYGDGLVRVWRFGEHSRYVGVLEKQRTNCIALSPDGKVALAGIEGGALWLAHPEAGVREPLPSQYCYGITQVRVTDQGRRGVVAGSIEPLRSYCLARASCDKEIGGEDDHCIDISPSGQRAVAYDWHKKNTSGYDMATGERMLLREGELDPSPHTAALLDQDGWRILYDHYDEALEILDLESGERVARFTGADSISIKDVTVSADGRFGASGGMNEKVRLWTLDESAPMREYEGHTYTVSAVAFDPAAERLASGSEDGSLRVWDVATGRCLACWQGEAPVSSCALTSTRAAVGTSRGKTLFFDLVPPGRLGEADQSGLQLPVRATSASWHPTRPLLGVGCVDGSVRILEWDEATGFVEIIRAMEALLPGQAITELTWSADGRRVRCVAWDGQVAIGALAGEEEPAGQDEGWQAARQHSPDDRLVVQLCGAEVLILPAGSQAETDAAAQAPTPAVHATIRGILWQGTPETCAWLSGLDDEELSKQLVVLSAQLYEAPTFDLLHGLLQRLGTVAAGDTGRRRLLAALPPLSSEGPAWVREIDRVRADDALVEHVRGAEDLAGIRGRVNALLTGLVAEGSEPGVSAHPGASELDEAVARYALRWGARHALAAGEVDRAAAWIVDPSVLAERLEAAAVSEIDDVLRDVGALRNACHEPALAAQLERWQRVLWRQLHAVADEPGKVRAQRVLAAAGADGAQAPWLEREQPQQGPRRRAKFMVSRAHRGWISSIALCADGHRAITGGVKDERVGVWDLRIGVCERLLEGHHSMINDVAISADGRVGVSAGSGEVRAWDLDTGECRRIVGGWSQFPQTANCLALTPDGRRALFGVFESKALVWDLDTNAVQQLEGHTEPVADVAMSPDGQRGISIGGEGALWVWDLTTGRKERAIDGAFESDSHSRLGLGAEGPAVAISDSELKRVDLETGEIAEGLGGSLSQLCLAPSGLLAATLDDDGWVEKWQLDADEPYGWVGIQPDSHDIALSADGHFAATANGDGSITVFDLQAEPGEPDSDDDVPFNRLALSASGRFAVSGGGEEEIVLWDVATGERQTVSGPEGAVWAVAITPDGRGALSAGNDNLVRCWRLATAPVGTEPPNLPELAAHAECRHVLRGHSDAVRSLAISADGARGMSGGKDGIVLLWDLAAGRRLHRLSDHEGEVNTVAMSPDGRLAASGGDDHTVRVWDVSASSTSSGHVLSGHEGYVWSIALDLSGRRIASGSNDETIRVWDLDTGRCEHVLRGLEQIPEFVGWVDQRFLVAACKRGSVQLWDTHEGRLAATWLSELSIQTGDVQGTRIALGLGNGKVELLRAVLP